MSHVWWRVGTELSGKGGRNRDLPKARRLANNRACNCRIVLITARLRV